MESIVQEQMDDSTAQPCFILDDTDLPKRGKAIEFIGRIFSHVTHRYGLGFKCMNLAYWSGKHLLHLDFSLHVERMLPTNPILIEQYAPHKPHSNRTYYGQLYVVTS